MSNREVEFRPCRKFPEYEVSAAGTVRNRKHGNVVRHKVVFGDPSRRRIVSIVRNLTPTDAFVDELINDAWPENRMGNIAA